MQQELVSRAEAAIALGLSEAGVRKLTERGDLPAVHIGRAVRIRVADLQAAILDGTPVTASLQPRS